MNDSSPFQDVTYAPIVLHNELSLVGAVGHLHAAVVQANIAAWRPGVAETLSALSDLFIVDPMLYAMEHQLKVDQASYQALPYCRREACNPGQMQVLTRDVRAFVRQVLQFQLDHGARLLLSPAFLSADGTDAAESANRVLLRAAVEAVSERPVSVPLYSSLVIGLGALRTEAVLRGLIEEYSDFPVTGHYLMVDRFDETASEPQAFWALARLVRGLSRGKDVIAGRFGAFGMVLLALGARCFTSGITTMEKFAQADLATVPGPRRAASRYYVPELLAHLPPDDVESLLQVPNLRSLACGCAHCERGLAGMTWRPLRLHFLARRFGEISDLRAQGADDRPAWMAARIANAIRDRRAAARAALVGLRDERLPIWEEVCSLPPQFSGDAGLSDEELRELIDEVRASEEERG